MVLAQLDRAVDFPLVPEVDYQRVPGVDFPLAPEADYQRVRVAGFPLDPEADYQRVRVADFLLAPEVDYQQVPEAGFPLVPEVGFLLDREITGAECHLNNTSDTMLTIAGGIILAIVILVVALFVLGFVAEYWKQILAVVAVIVGLIFIAVTSDNHNNSTQVSTARPPEKYTQPAQPEQQKHLTLADLQSLHNKRLESSSTNTSPPPHPLYHHTAEALGKCLIAAANTYQIPPAVLIGMLQVEAGLEGEETKPDSDFQYFMGPMHVSNRMIPVVAQVWNVDFDTAHDWLKNDGCVNVHVAAWILAQKLSESGTLYQAIGLYHFTDPATATDYTKKVIDAMDKKGLIYHDAPMPK